EVPGPDRRAQVFQARHHTDESVGLAWVMRRPELQHHLVLLAEVDLLAMTALRQIPDVDLVAVIAGKQGLGVEGALEHLWRAPLGRDRGVVSEASTAVVGELFWCA